MADIPVKFFKGTLQQYESITPDPYTFYFIMDKEKVFLGTLLLSNENIQQIEQLLSQKANIFVHTTAEWQALVDETGQKVISQQKSFYIYTDRVLPDGTIGPGIKIGDGSAYVIDLPFVDDFIVSHINNKIIHITQYEREYWNDKMNSIQLYNNETLVFTKDKDIYNDFYS